ncbi:hypothetical protein, partial [Escherichia coli]|uniref:hypothetical protein n=1 Tax=Escherichia coli TaxID=562 RepID=UPI0019533A48
SDTDKDKIGSLIKRVEEIQADETKQAEYQNITQHALFLSRYDLEKIGFRALKLNVDMVNEPDLALNPEYSLFILIDEFKYGEFTG